ncbi:MAG TPA: response regulator [Candidatus Micrarchaeia archaeon]|nr:response regulator [Candidatus Micrarchaeia archaeon]
MAGAEPAAGAKAGGAVGAHILYLEDEAAIALLYRLALEAAGYRITIAVDAASGVAAAPEIRPDLVLVDYHLPDRNGVDVVRALRAEPATRSVPIIILSNDDAPAVIRDATAAGATEVLTKILWRPPRLIEALPGWLGAAPAAGT